jgi:hypothetical protein
MFKIGEKYFIRTVTFHMLGEITEIQDPWVRLAHASWIADSGSFGEAIKRGVLAESEYVGEAFVNLTTATDVIPWRHELPNRSI